MKDVITGILSDTSLRDEASIEAALVQQAVAIPWVDVSD